MVGFVVYYCFDGSINDVIGNMANIGVIIGNFYYICGVENDVIFFDGQDDEIVILGGLVNDEFDNEDVFVSFYFKLWGGAGMQYFLFKCSFSCFGGNEFYIIYMFFSWIISVFFFEINDWRIIVIY